MAPEELLKPRYKIIADFPGNPYEVGEIIGPFFNEGPDKAAIDYYGSYPHLFEKMEWWEDRRPEEMPEYVKYGTGEVVKPVYNFNHYGVYFTGRGIRPDDLWNIDKTLPATKEEYESHNTPAPVTT